MPIKSCYHFGVLAHVLDCLLSTNNYLTTDDSQHSPYTSSTTTVSPCLLDLGLQVDSAVSSIALAASGGTRCT